MAIISKPYAKRVRVVPIPDKFKWWWVWELQGEIIEVQMPPMLFTEDGSFYTNHEGFPDVVTEEPLYPMYMVTKAVGNVPLGALIPVVCCEDC